MASFRKYLEGVRSRISEIEPADLRGAGPGTSRAIIDVREQAEVAQGVLPGSVWIPRGFLELRIEEAIADRDHELILYCEAGIRSALAAAALQELGYRNVRSLAGGFEAWKRAGYPFEMPALLDADQSNRYLRHTTLPEVGDAGQLRLLSSSVLCIGAGGLGSPATMYLAAAGVGTIGVVDDDVVDRSNLQRQILHNSERVGTRKVDSAVRTLTGLNPDVTVRPLAERLASDNAIEVLTGYDVVVDGTDNFPTRYLVNDACIKLGIPVVHASIYRFEGQLTVFGAQGQPCYRCLYPEPPPPEEAPSCAEAGVIGVLPGVLGVLQATEAIKLLLNLGRGLAGRLLLYDALALSFREVQLRPDPQCVICGPAVDREAIELIDYDGFCSRQTRS